MVLRDISGAYSVADVTLIVQLALTTPVGINNCYLENVNPGGYAFDVLYILGTLKHNKLQVAVPRTSAGISCELLVGFLVDM